MAGYHVTFRISCPKPAREELAFLGPLKATAQYMAGRLHVGIDVDAGDVVGALARARDLVLGGLTGKVEVATVTATDDVLVPPGRLFGRKFN